MYQPNGAQRLIHIVARENRLESFTPRQRADYERLVKWLADRGESLETARADIKRWDSWSRTTGEYRRKMDEEIGARKAREAEVRAKANGRDD